MAPSKDSSYPFGVSSVVILGVVAVMTPYPEMKYVDFHTHFAGCEKYLNDDTVLVVQSLHLDEELHPRADYASIGVHPMLPGAKEVLQKYQEAPEELMAKWIDRIKSSRAPIIALGECGWDPRSPLSIDEQHQLIDLHLEISRLLKLPIVFHVVSGWHHLLKKHKEATTSWFVHGFRGNPQLAQQLTNAGILISLHPLAPTPPIKEFLLETDDTSIHIKTHYQSRNIDCEDRFNVFSRLFIP